MKKNAERLVEPDRIHRLCYTDQGVFESELDNIFESTWVYCGHETQIRNPGDYVSVQIGRQCMLMVRTGDGAVRVLYNRCPHRGTQLCVKREGNTGEEFVCSYHAWRFDLDGTLIGVPLEHGYANTRMSVGDPAFNLKRAACVDSYRGFTFARLIEDGPSLREWLGDAKVAFDDMCDRSPEGEVEIVPVCHRILQHSNWKLFMENQLDALHPSITHESAGRAAVAVEKEIERLTGAGTTRYKPLSTIALPLSTWEELQTVNYPYGHGLIKAYMEPPKHDDAIEYNSALRARYGEREAREILSRQIHHVLIYPSVSVQPPLQQLRAIRPLSVGCTLSEIWHFRLKGAPDPIYRHALNYFNLINSPATIINADDLENWSRAQRGLASSGSEWISLHRDFGNDIESPDRVTSRSGTSEAPMRNQYKAWLHYMRRGDGS